MRDRDDGKARAIADAASYRTGHIESTAISLTHRQECLCHQPQPLAAADESDDLDFVTLLNGRVGMLSAGDQHAVALDGHELGFQSQRLDEVGDRHRPLDLARLAVEANVHG